MDTSDDSVQIIAEKKASKLDDDGMTPVAQNQASTKRFFDSGFRIQGVCLAGLNDKKVYRSRTGLQGCTCSHIRVHGHNLASISGNACRT